MKSANQEPAARKVYLYSKRAFDVAASLAGMAILLPFLPLIALVIKLDSKGPVFFTQTRLGKDGELFAIYKFRTMEHHAAEVRSPDGSKFVARNDPRLTRVGRILRDASIDELPQLWNILKGEMSVVGPRPDTPGASGLSDANYRTKRSMRPGLTSLASVHGRNSIPWKERIGWELQYIDCASLGLDFWILFKTAVLVLRREGIYSSNSFTRTIHMGASTPNKLTEAQSNEAKLEQAFAKAFAIPLDPAIQEMAYGQVACWDSTAHMVLIAEIEATFGVLLTTDDVLDLSSYRKAREILVKYGVALETAR